MRVHTETEEPQYHFPLDPMLRWQPFQLRKRKPVAWQCLVIVPTPNLESGILIDFVVTSATRDRLTLSVCIDGEISEETVCGWFALHRSVNETTLAVIETVAQTAHMEVAEYLAHLAQFDCLPSSAL